MPKENLELANSLQMVVPIQSNLFDTDNLEQMSIAEFQQKKDLLSNMKQQVMLQVDSKKMEQALKVMHAMDILLNRMIDINSDEDGNPIVPSAKEMKEYAGAYRDLVGTLNVLSRMDSIDSTGRAANIYLRVEFEG